MIKKVVMYQAGGREMMMDLLDLVDHGCRHPRPVYQEWKRWIALEVVGESRSLMNQSGHLPHVSVAARVILTIPPSLLDFPLSHVKTKSGRGST